MGFQSTAPKRGDSDNVLLYKIAQAIDEGALSSGLTQADLDNAIADLVDSAPAALDTLNELAAALGDDANFSATVISSLANKVDRPGDTMTGMLQFSGTGHFGLKLNSLTTAQRDAVGVGAAGNLIWNTTTSRLDFNIGGLWKNFVRLDGDTMTGILVAPRFAFTANDYLLGIGGALDSYANGTPQMRVESGFIAIRDDFRLGADVTGQDVILRRDAANTLALRNSTNAQTFRVYNTFTDASNYERGFVRFSGNVFQVGAENAGTGVVRSCQLVGVGNSITVGANGSITYISNTGASQHHIFSGNLLFGDTTSSFPGLKRSTTNLHVRLADDSAFTGITASAFSIGTAETGWAPTNVTTDKAFDANATSLDEVADVLGTLILRLRTAFPGLVDA